MRDAQAYIDPATTSYIIQIVAAFFITLGVLLSVFTTRVKLFLLKMKTKILTEHYSKQQGRGNEASAGSRKNGSNASADVSLHPQRAWKSRAGLALLCSFAVMFTFVIFGIYDLFISNREVLPLVFSDIWGLFLLTGLAGCLFLTLCISILKGNAFDIAISLLVGGLLAGYLQGNFFNINFGTLTGESIPWEHYKFEAMGNTLIWIVIMSMPFIVKHYSKLIWQAVCLALPLLLVTIQLISLIVTLVSTGAMTEVRDDRYLSTAGIYEMSSRENVLVFLLDRLDDRNLRRIAEEDPAYFDDLDGFTRYTDNMSYYARTYPSVIQMLTGEKTLFDVSRDEFATMAYSKPNFIKELKKDGYDTKLFMEISHPFTRISQLDEIANNIETGETKVDAPKIVGNFLELSAFKYGPFVFKPSFWTEASKFAQLLAYTDMQNAYFTDDRLFYTNLLSSRLTLQDEENNFAFYHLNGSHTPYSLNAQAEVVDKSETNEYEQTRGCFHILREIFREMKRLGIYESANIIITGDHGVSEDIRPLWYTSQTGLFVKRKGEAGTPLAINKAPVNADNFRGSIVKMAGLDLPEYPEAYWDIPEDSDRVRPFFYRVDTGSGSGYLEEFQVSVPGNNFDNWNKVAEHPFSGQ